MAVDDKLYFLGFMPDHFTGPNWTGPATYQSFDITTAPQISAHDAVNQNPSTPGSCFQMTNSPNYMLTGKLKDDSGNPLSSFNFVLYSYVNRSNNRGRQWQTIGVLLALYCGTTMVLEIIPKVNTLDYTLILTNPIDSSVIATTTIPFNQTIWYQPWDWNSVELIKTIVYVDNWGTKDSTLRVVHCSEDGLNKWFDNTFPIDSSAFSHIDRFSIGNVGTSYNGNGAWSFNVIYYAYACNFDPLRCTFDWYVENTAGSVNEWNGDTKSFLTSPITYDVDVHGLYTNSSNTTVTFARPRSFYFPDRHKARMVITQTAGFMGEMGETGVLQPVVKNPTTGMVKPFGDNVTLNDTGGLYTWYSTIDPTTNNPWLKVDETNYEFGIKRIS